MTTDRRSAQFWIALGGNMGDTPAIFSSARQAICHLPATELLATSPRYRTPPIGPAGQRDYLNAVITVRSALSPLQMLDALQQIETDHGRVRREHWGARSLDLDIIAIDDKIIAQPRLHVPHPHMHQRQFVLRPLCDLTPNWQHPLLKQRASTLLDAIIASGEEAFPEGEIW